jgi:sigma-B regulation protein RsbU (phosphoserine phosphatase)
MPRIREIAKKIGISGILFTFVLLCFIAAYLAGKSVAVFFLVLLLIPLTTIVMFRVLRYIQVHSLWSVRNRLLFVYVLMGLLPIFLLFILVGVGAWAFTTELAIYLANSALERKVATIDGSARVLQSMPADRRRSAAAEFQDGLRHEFPGFRLYIKDQSGEHRFPADSPDLNLPADWQNANGLLVWHGHFYGWSHVTADGQQVTALAPLSDEMVSGLVPNLGAIGLVERTDTERTDKSKEPETAASAGALHQGPNGDEDASGRPGILRLPPAMGRFDIPLVWVASVSHSHIEQPNGHFDTILSISSRPSAVLSTVFGKAESFRGLIFQIFLGVAILFLIVEVVAILIGIRLSGRLTNSINQLHEGTRRVIKGDFRHRISVRSKDQLGELGESFNKMTGNIERLMAVEKEKERMQTELEIAREVQGQLYPKDAPPLHGLELTVQCDPARMVSGDYYDYTDIGQTRLAFALGDVAGKGISAALLMATLQAALRAQISHYQAGASGLELDPSSVVSLLNKQVHAHTSPEKYATFFFAVFDPPTYTLTYTNAGHLSPLLLRNGEFTPLDSNGTVVGAFSFATYTCSSLVMKPGDLLVCYTDGITEPENAYGEMFGEERLMDLVKKHACQPSSDILNIVMESVRGWTGNPELFDDMTLLLARGVQLA